MRALFKIEDERHAEIQPGEFVSLAAVAVELRRLADVPWDQAPNVAPCANWRECGRSYEVVEYDVSTQPWRELRRFEALGVDSKGARWLNLELAALGLQ
jgi:hypothetical protein